MSFEFLKELLQLNKISIFLKIILIKNFLDILTKFKIEKNNKNNSF